MRSLRSSSNKTIRALLLLALMSFVTGCAGTRADLRKTSQTGEIRVAVLPVENLSGSGAPLQRMRHELIDQVSAAGLTVCDEAVFSRFFATHRIRYTGGIDEDLSRAMKAELGVEAVLVTSLELYTEDSPPKIGMFSRLVSTGDRSEILWMDSIAVTGDESPGILNLGVIEDPAKLRQKALNSLIRSLERHLAGARDRGDVAGKYQPKVAFSGVSLDTERKPVIAVLPFVNQSLRKNAGEIQVLHFVKQLVNTGAFNVMEPGIVRNRMLRMRIIMQEGVALPQVDLIALSMKVDFILTGKVFEYQDYIGGFGTPKIDFSVQLFDGAGKNVVWASKSYNEGNDGVFFYDWGRTYAAGTLADKMTRAVVNAMVERRPPLAPAGDEENVQPAEKYIEILLHP